MPELVNFGRILALNIFSITSGMLSMYVGFTSAMAGINTLAVGGFDR